MPCRTIATMVVNGLHSHLVPLAESLRESQDSSYAIVVFAFDNNEHNPGRDDSIRKLLPYVDIRHLGSPDIGVHSSTYESMVRTGLALNEILQSTTGLVLWVDPAAQAPDDLPETWRAIASMGIWAPRSQHRFSYVALLRVYQSAASQYSRAIARYLRRYYSKPESAPSTWRPRCAEPCRSDSTHWTGSQSCRSSNRSVCVCDCEQRCTSMSLMIKQFTGCASDVQCVTRLAPAGTLDGLALQGAYLSSLMIMSGYTCNYK